MGPFFWFLFGGVVGGGVGAAITGKATRIGLGVAMTKLQTLPEPCRTYVEDSLKSISEQDVFNEMVAESQLSPEDIEQLRRQHPPSPVPYMQQFAQPPAPPSHPSAAAGALWMHHGYYDPYWPCRVYGCGYR